MENKDAMHCSYVEDQTIAEATWKKDPQHKHCELVSSVINMVDTLVLVLDHTGNIILFNDACEKLTGYSCHEVKGQSFMDYFILQEEKQSFEVAFFQTFNSGSPCQYHNHWRTRDGHVRLIKWSNAMLPDSLDHDQYIVSTGIDITEQEATRRDLAKNEQHYRRLVELSPDAIIMHQDGIIVYANAATAKLLNYSSPEALLKKTIFELIHPDFHKKVTQRLKNIMLTGHPSPYMEQKIFRSDGTTVDVELTGSLLAYNEKDALQVTIRDITERKKVEHELFNASKLQSVGRLAGSIAHDFNNLLTIILGNLSLARYYTSDNENVSSTLQEIEDASNQARELTQRLLTFASGGRPVKHNVDLRKILIKAASLTLQEEQVSYNLQIPGELFPVYADQGLLYQALNNLINNAIQAMPAGGTIHISAENVHAENIRNLPMAEGAYVKITIADEGTGIAHDVLTNIFEPFYTTKPDSSGLGLPTSYSIIHNHGGFLTVESDGNNGSTFYIHLPALLSSELPAEKETGIHTGHGRILLMDDERAIRATAQEMLSLLGYEVITAVDGAEALSCYSAALEAGEPFAAVILDLTVKGGMGGKETCEKLLAHDPNARTIVSSGYFNDPVMSDYKKYGFAGCVPKPYGIETLGQVLKSVL